MHNHLHRPWKPSPAAKPSHLTSATTQSLQSPAALQGASLAFAARPNTLVHNIGQISPPLEENAGFDAGSRRGRSTIQQNVTGTKPSSERSQSRGRHLSPTENAILAGARSAIASTSPPTARPDLDRTPSMIAARLASSSPSPIRANGSPSPPKISRLSSTEGPPPGTDLVQTRNARSKIPSSQRSTQDADSMSLHEKQQNLDLDRVPILVPQSRPAGAADMPPSKQEPRKIAQRPKTASTAPVPIPAPIPRNNTSTFGLSRSGDASLLSALDQRLVRSKPPTPAPRKGRNLAQSPLQADLSGSRIPTGLTREQAINRMADAMVASSLASRRPASPSKSSPSRHRKRSMSASNIYKLPSPEPVDVPLHYKQQKPMKHTLRKASPQDEESIEVTKRGRRHLVRKHPNMHHEGDRKRWRDKVTESERKRYEGVFAANRGLLLKTSDGRTSPSKMVDPNAINNQVVNVVVRDIWERSRLPGHVLEQVYDLVASENAKILNREQFVVGLWLIDQKLKGRKLPVKVTESVWASVRHSQGIKVSRPIQR